MKFRPVLIAGLVPASSAAANGERPIVWPAHLVHPDSDLQVDEIDITLRCAELVSIAYIPPDWNVEVIRPVSATSEVHLSAGHGASNLTNLAALDGKLRVGRIDASCFDASARIVGRDWERNLTREELGL